jgi:bifunctional UDP-N-acetylglucosamine pyrophosphorylase/glucosamine-1-phosphate N-acetyltransferase
MPMNLDYFFSYTEEFYFPDVFRGVEYPWEVLENSKKLLQSMLTKKPNMSNRSTRRKINFYGNYSIGKNTTVYNDVTIMGPVIIGENCTIMPGALIRPGTIIGNNCTIGHGSEIKNSIIQNGAKIQSLTFVGDSVIGKSARIGSGVITANRKFNQSNIIMKTPDGPIDTGSGFFGCVLGDNSRVGANCVTQPGTLIGKYCWIYPMTSVRGFIPEAKRVFHNNAIVMEDNERIDLKE